MHSEKVECSIFQYGVSWLRGKRIIIHLTTYNLIKVAVLLKTGKRDICHLRTASYWKLLVMSKLYGYLNYERLSEKEISLQMVDL